MPISSERRARASAVAFRVPGRAAPVGPALCAASPACGVAHVTALGALPPVSCPCGRRPLPLAPHLPPPFPTT
eukprot:845566-Pleurochrysis_carterae.AAC.1